MFITQSNLCQRILLYLIILIELLILSWKALLILYASSMARSAQRPRRRVRERSAFHRLLRQNRARLRRLPARRDRGLRRIGQGEVRELLRIQT